MLSSAQIFAPTSRADGCLEEMVTVHVRDDDGVDGFQAEMLPKAIECRVEGLLIQQPQSTTKARPLSARMSPKFGQKLGRLNLKRWD